MNDAWAIFPTAEPSSPSFRTINVVGRANKGARIHRDRAIFVSHPSLKEQTPWCNNSANSEL